MIEITIGDDFIRNLFVILVLLLLFLTGCMTSKSDEGKPDDQATGTPSETKNEPGDKEEDDSESSSESKYKAENELEEKYFKIIAATEKWESFISDFTYLEQLFGDDDIEQEIYSTTRYVLEPFQLHRTYHSIYFRNDNLEIYATEDEAYENRHFTEWEKVSNPSVYLVNPIPSRTDLLYALIDGAEELYETDQNVATFDIDPSNWEDLSKKVQLTYFRNLVNYDTASDEGADDLLKPLNEIEGILVEIKTDGKHITSIDILISFNRLDPDSVDQLHFYEEYSDINSFTTIEIPSEVRGK